MRMLLRDRGAPAPIPSELRLCRPAEACARALVLLKVGHRGHTGNIQSLDAEPLRVGSVVEAHETGHRARRGSKTHIDLPVSWEADDFGNSARKVGHEHRTQFCTGTDQG